MPSDSHGFLSGICDGVIVWRFKKKKKEKLGNVKEDWQKVANATLNQISPGTKSGLNQKKKIHLQSQRQWYP